MSETPKSCNLDDIEKSADSQQKPLSGPHLAKSDAEFEAEGTGNVASDASSSSLPFGGLTKEQLMMVNPMEAERDMVMWIEDMLLNNPMSLTDDQKRAVAIKMSYWTKLFHAQGALRFQMLYEKKVRDLAEKRKSGKIVLPRKTLMVPFKYKGKSK